jgi:hypothetical protein
VVAHSLSRLLIVANRGELGVPGRDSSVGVHVDLSSVSDRASLGCVCCSMGDEEEPQRTDKQWGNESLHVAPRRGGGMVEGNEAIFISLVLQEREGTGNICLTCKHPGWYQTMATILPISAHWRILDPPSIEDLYQAASSNQVCASAITGLTRHVVPWGAPCLPSAPSRQSASSSRTMPEEAGAMLRYTRLGWFWKRDSKGPPN